MIFAAGELLPPEKLPEVLDGLEARIQETLSGPPLEAETVISALDGLGRALESGELDPLLLQYAPPGTREELEEVSWMLRRETLEARLEDHRLVFGVTDTGPGFSPEALRKAGRLLYTGDAARHDAHQGLGLYTARQVAVAHGGGLDLRNAPTGGGCAELWLPAAVCR